MDNDAENQAGPHQRFYSREKFRRHTAIQWIWHIPIFIVCIVDLIIFPVLSDPEKDDKLGTIATNCRNTALAFGIINLVHYSFCLIFSLLLFRRMTDRGTFRLVAFMISRERTSVLLRQLSTISIVVLVVNLFSFIPYILTFPNKYDWQAFRLGVSASYFFCSLIDCNYYYWLARRMRREFKVDDDDTELPEIDANANHNGNENQDNHNQGDLPQDHEDQVKQNQQSQHHCDQGYSYQDASSQRSGRPLSQATTAVVTDSDDEITQDSHANNSDNHDFRANDRRANSLSPLDVERHILQQGEHSDRLFQSHHGL